MLALLLALCMLIGLPMSVQANDSTEEFKVVKVVEMPDNKATTEMPKGKTVFIYFNNTPSADSLSITGYQLSVNIRLSADGKDPDTGADLAHKDMNCSIVASYGANPLAVTFGTSLSDMRNDGYDTFSVYVKENTTGTSADVGYINGFADINGTLLTANVSTVDTKNEISIMDIIAEPFKVVKVEELHDKYATDQLLAGRTVLVYFSNTPSADALADTGFGKRTNIRIHVTGAEPAVDINGEIVASYGTNPIAVTFGNDIDNNFPAWREAGYDTFELGFKEYNDTVASNANLGWIEGFVDVNGTALTGVTNIAGVTEEARTTIDGPRYIAAKIGDVEYETLESAMNEAVSGDTVSLMDNVTVTDTVFVLNAGVNLDLYGYELTVNNMMAFGQVVDSTEGGGKLVVDPDARVILLEDNEDMPLYDTDGYRFFTYEFLSEQRASGVENTNKYAIHLGFDSADAYGLLATDANADLKIGVAMTITKADGSTRAITYHFSQAILDKYAKQSAEDLDGKKALTLTVSGLESLDDANLSARAVVTSPTLITLNGALKLAQ